MSRDNHEFYRAIEQIKTHLMSLKESGFTYIPKKVGMSEKTNFKGEKVVDPILLETIRAEIGDCHRCSLCNHRSNIVFGDGNPHASIVFVGEAPGAEEDKQGKPFVGRAGKLLTKMINAMGLERDEVYICNVVKCRPPENRDPEPQEISSCEPFLRKQLQAIRPKVIVGLGRHACQTLLNTTEAMSKIRGKWREYDGISFMPTFHPAYLLRTPSAKKLVWQDLQAVMEAVGIDPVGEEQASNAQLGMQA